MSQITKSSKPPKLRAACNQCNATKIKCSGERTGCRRCQTLQVDCIYAESRVGRVPGIRGKRRQKARGTADMGAEQEEPEVADTNASTSASNLSSSSSTSTNPPMTVDNGFFFDQPPAGHRGQAQSTTGEPFEDVLLSWSNEHVEPHIDMFNSSDHMFASLVSHEHDEHHEMSPPVSERRFQRSTSRATFSQAGSDFQVRALDFEARDNDDRPQFALARSKHFQQSSLSSKVQPRYKTPSGSHSQCVMTCSQIILRLEKYLVDELKVLDLIFGIIKKVLAQLNPLAELQLTARDSKCLTLFGVIANQIIELLESGCNNYFVEEYDDDPTEGHIDFMGSSLPGLGFGSFTINPEDQRRWRSQIVLDEMQPIAENLGKIVALVNSNVQRTAHSRDMQASIDLLVDTARRRGGL